MNAAGGLAALRRPLALEWAPAACIVAAAVLVGLSLGDPAPHWRLPVLAASGIAVLYSGFRWPYASVLVLVGSTVLLPAVVVSGARSANPFDVLLLPALIASGFGVARRDAFAQREAGPLHEGIRRAETRFVRAALVFFGLALLSLFSLARLAGPGAAASSLLSLGRALQGLALYPLCQWWLRDQRRVDHAWRALFVAGISLTIVNLFAVSLWGVPRAGMTVFLNDAREPIASPNEAGVASLLVCVVLLVRHAMRPQAWHALIAGALLVLLVLTQSRSGLLAWGTFGLLALRWVRPTRLLAGALSLALLLPLVPGSFWQRMSRSILLEKGTFEAFTWFQRVYDWITAWRVFLDHAFTGVGYLGYRFVSQHYNSLGVAFGTVENYYLEMLVSMGVFGFAALVWVLVELFRLGHAVGRTARPGTLAARMARFHTPLFTALLVANLTGDNFVGMVAVAQIAMWTAILVRAGHAAVSAAEARA